MNKILIAGISAALAASVASSGLPNAGPAGAATVRATGHSAVAASCRVAHHNYAYPGKPTSYGAGAAGSVTIAPVNKGTIKVTAVHRAHGYRAYIDSSNGSSVDVYFHNSAHRVKFEAEINDSGGLTVTVTTCPR